MIFFILLLVNNVFSLNCITVFPNSVLLPIGCDTVNVTLLIDGTWDATDTPFLKFSNITSFGENLEIKGSNLTTLTGLESVAKINGNLLISNNNLLVNLSGLEGLNYIGGSLSVQQHAILESISSLSGVSHVSNSITIEKNDLLQSVDALKQIRNISGSLSIQFNFQVSNLDLLNFEHIGGDFFLRRLDLTTEVNGFENLTFVGGEMSIQFSDNIRLLRFPKLEYVKDRFLLYALPKLSLTSGFESLAYVGMFSIRYNHGITNIDTFKNLLHIGGNTRIDNNNKLVSIQGLNSVITIDGSISYHTNPSQYETCFASLLNVTGCNECCTYCEGFELINSTCTIINPCISDNSCLISTDCTHIGPGRRECSCHCINGVCSINDGSCNCTGTRFEGDFCEISKPVTTNADSTHSAADTIGSSGSSTGSTKDELIYIQTPLVISNKNKVYNTVTIIHTSLRIEDVTESTTFHKLQLENATVILNIPSKLIIEDRLIIGSSTLEVYLSGEQVVEEYREQIISSPNIEGTFTKVSIFIDGLEDEILKVEYEDDGVYLQGPSTSTRTTIVIIVVSITVAIIISSAIVLVLKKNNCLCETIV